MFALPPCIPVCLCLLIWSIAPSTFASTLSDSNQTPDPDPDPDAHQFCHHSHPYPLPPPDSEGGPNHRFRHNVATAEQTRKLLAKRRRRRLDGDECSETQTDFWSSGSVWANNGIVRSSDASAFVTLQNPQFGQSWKFTTAVKTTTTVAGYSGRTRWSTRRCLSTVIRTTQMPPRTKTQPGVFSRTMSRCLSCTARKSTQTLVKRTTCFSLCSWLLAGCPVSSPK